MSKSLKEQIVKMGKGTLLTNQEIARLVGCSPKTVFLYAGSFSSRCKEKTSKDKELFRVRKAVLLPDIHYPHVDKKAMEAVNQFIFDYAPDELVYMGDQLSLDCISKWNKSKPLLKEGQRIISDFENFDKEILQVHEKITPKETKRTFLLGNHEERLKWYIEEHPELEKMIDIDRNLKLTARGYKIVPFNEIHKIGKLNVIHGYYWNKYHASRTLEAFGGNVVYAHVHNPQMFAKVSPVDRKEYHMATALPCLCDIKPDYKKDAPNFWVNGFGIVEHLPATGYFNQYTMIIIDGGFMWNGVYYGKEI